MEEMVKEQAAAVAKAKHPPPWLQPHADSWCGCYHTSLGHPQSCRLFTSGQATFMHVHSGRSAQ
jgi:hypothetical protein